MMIGLDGIPQNEDGGVGIIMYMMTVLIRAPIHHHVHDDARGWP